MATDNRSDSLFPDVTERYEPNTEQGTDGAETSAPQENFTPDLEAYPYERVLPVTQIEPDAITASDDAPTDAFAPVEHVDSSAELRVIFDPEPIDVSDTDGHDPFAHAPDWVRAHIPRQALEMPEQKRGGLGAALSRRPRRPAAPIPAAAPELTPEPVTEAPAPAPTAGDDTTSTRPLLKQPWVIGSAAAGLIAITAVGVVAAFGGSTDETATAAPSTSTTAAETTADETEAAVAAAAPWCADSVEPGRTVGRGPGDPANPVGVIQAFDHAYYVARDSSRVASLMLTPNPVPAIQSKIDEWFATRPGTEHCLTIVATPDPNVFNVDLLLRWPPGKEGVIRQRITVAPAEGGFKIAKVVDL